MIDLQDLKKRLEGDHNFYQGKSIESLKQIVATGENLANDDEPCVDNVPCVLEAGNLDIEITIYYNEDTHMHYLGYFCCHRINGQWESCKEIDVPINLDAPDLQEEMLRVLASFAEQEGLSFFD